MKPFAISILLLFLSISATSESVLNVKDFGAKGDGIADDTRAIQAAIDKAPPNSMTTIYFPGGIYNIASYTRTPNYLENYSLLLHSNLNIKGNGGKTVIRVADHIFDKNDTSTNAHLFLGLIVKNISFFNLTIDLNGANNLVPLNVMKNHSAIFLAQGGNCYIHDVTIKNCSGTNMLNIMGHGSKLLIENCKFLNGGNYVGVPEPNKNQVDFSFVYSEWDSTLFRKNTVKQENIDIGLGKNSGGVELHGSFSSATNNYFEGCNPAIYISSDIGRVTENVLVQNNRIFNCVAGIIFWLGKPMKNITIADNEITLTHSRSPIYILASGIIVPNGNLKKYNRHFANGATITNLQVKNNLIRADSMTTLSAGMVLHSLYNSLIENNTITGMNYGGIVLTGSKWGTDSLIVKKNRFNEFRPNNDQKAAAGYIVITDTYSGEVKDAPGFKNVFFIENKFLRSDVKAAAKARKDAKGTFYGTFIAIPSKMIGNIKFENNQYSDIAEKEHKILKID
jgi:parallel beta-helix repeat protein